MGVMYLFDSLQKVRAAILNGVTQCIHHEAAHTLDAAIPSTYQAEPGEYLGFLCVDGLWRLFCITEAEDDDTEGVCYIKATDAAVDDLEHIVVQDKYQEGVTAQTAAAALLEGTEWQLATVTTDETTNNTDAKWVSLWQALLTLAEVYGAQVEPYYIIQDGEITGKRINLLKDEPVFRGRLYESRINADDVRRIKRKRPVTVLYGLGKAQGTGDEAENLTFADAVWSKANGDPADKPAGQTWVEDVEASARYGRREQILTAGDIEDQNELLKATWEELQEQKKPEITVELTIHDAEQMHGGEWRTVRRGDLVIVRTKAGRDTETRVIDIERDYMRQELTKFTSGKELPKATNQTAGLIRASIKTQETLTVYRNRFEHDEALIQLYANTILVHADELLSLRAGVDGNLAQITLANGRIDALANEIALHANDILTLSSGVDDNAAAITLANGRIDANANAISLQANNVLTLEAGVTENKAAIALANGDIALLADDITANANAISLKADQASLDLANGRIDAQANEIALKANKIDLQGFVTATELETVRASVANLTSGLTTAQVLRSNWMYSTNGDFTYLSAAAFTHNGALVSQRNITMGGVTSVGKALSTGGELDLQHSHAVIVNDDGTITLGEVSAEGGNFKIADTKAYKDGVSAAYGNGYNVGFDAGKDAYLPTAIVRDSYSTADKTVTVRALNSHQDLLTGQVIDAKEIYKAGWDAAVAKLAIDGNVIKGPGTTVDEQADLYTITAGGSINSIRNTAANYMFAEGYTRAYINGEQVASVYISKGQSFNLGQ